MTRSKYQVPMGRVRSLKYWQTNTTKTGPVQVEPCVPQKELQKRLLLGDRIGKGGMSIIEEAFDANLLTRLARKTILPELSTNEDACGHLVEEAQITAQLDHPNIVPVHELGVDHHGRLYFTMKLVRGKTLYDIIQSKNANMRTERDLFEQLQILLKICDAISFAHSRGVIHRDLKPDNIMVGEYGEVYLMDWGLARLTKKWRPERTGGEVVTEGRQRYRQIGEEGINATILYMAPEQSHGNSESIDERTDIFGLGAILYEILTQKSPYADSSVSKIVQRALLGDVVLPQDAVEIDLPDRLCDIAMRAMKRVQDERYESVSEFKHEIESFLQSGWQFRRRVFPKGSLIIREGDPGEEAFIITVGHCRVFKMVDGRKVVLEEIGVGDVFGEIAVFTNRPRSASVEAIDQVSVMVITKRHMEEDLGMSFWLGLFAKALGDRLIDADKRIFELERTVQELKNS